MARLQLPRCFSIRVQCLPRLVHAASRQNDTPLQSTRRPHFYREEVTGHDLLPVSVEELLPRRLSAAFQRWLDAMPSQDVCDRVVRYKVTHIGKRSLNPPVTPCSILLRHPDNQLRDFLRRSPSPSRSKRTAIIFLRDQFSMPSQQSLGSDDACHLRQ